jgi:hypothetical protein
MTDRAEQYVGVDVSKDQLDVAVVPSGETYSFANDQEGIRDLVAALPEATRDTVGERCKRCRVGGSVLYFCAGPHRLVFVWERYAG